MKKIYVKPEAFSVAFAVNENIAISGQITSSADGVITYVQAVEGCNKYINGTEISTGLREGCYDINHVMQHLQDRQNAGNMEDEDLVALGKMLEELQAAANATGGVPNFVCAQ